MFIFSSIKSDIFAKSLLKYNYQLKSQDILAGEVIGLERKHAILNVGINRSAILPNKNIYVKASKYPIEILTIGDTGEFLISFFTNLNKKIIASIIDLHYSRLWLRYKQLDLNNLIFYGLTNPFISIRKGKIVNFDNLKVFVPNLHLPKYYKRQKTKSFLLPLKTLELKNYKKSYALIASCRLAILKKQSTSLKLGSIHLSCILNIRAFGLFVSINGIKCLLHISEISSKRITDIFSLYKIGDQILVKIIYMNIEQGKIAVSAKQLENQI